MVLLETSETWVPLVSSAGHEDRIHGTLKNYLAVQPMIMLNAVIPLLLYILCFHTRLINSIMCFIHGRRTNPPCTKPRVLEPGIVISLAGRNSVSNVLVPSLQICLDMLSFGDYFYVYVLATFPFSLDPVLCLLCQSKQIYTETLGYLKLSSSYVLRSLGLLIQRTFEGLVVSPRVRVLLETVLNLAWRNFIEW